MSKNEPIMYHEVGITYCVPPFTKAEEIYIGSFGMVPVSYRWTHKPTGKTGLHIVHVFSESVKRFPILIAHWNRTEEWEYTLPNAKVEVH